MVREGVEDSDFDRVFASFKKVAEIKLPWRGNAHADLFAVDRNLRGGDDLTQIEGLDGCRFFGCEGDRFLILHAPRVVVQDAASRPVPEIHQALAVGVHADGFRDGGTPVDTSGRSQLQLDGGRAR